MDLYGVYKLYKHKTMPGPLLSAIDMQILKGLAPIRVPNPLVYAQQNENEKNDCNCNCNTKRANLKRKRESWEASEQTPSN